MINRFFKQIKNVLSKNNSLPDVVLHIGAPKCGSSAIQRFCILNRVELLKKGYYYPKHHLDVNNVSGGHSSISSPLINNERDEAVNNFQKSLIRAKKQKACLLLSAEGFYGQHEAMLEMTKGLNVKIVGFLRHPVEYLVANHNQGIKRHMSTHRLFDLIPQVVSKPARHLSGQPLLDWGDAFGDSNCIFIPYKSPSSGGDLIESIFLSKLGFSDSECIALTQNIQGLTNRSYVKSALELKRIFNTVLDLLPSHSVNKVDWALQHYSDNSHDQKSYTLSDISPDAMKVLETHFFSEMQPVIKRFPELKSLASFSNTKDFDQSSGWLDLNDPLNAIRVEIPEVLEEIYEQAIIHRDKGRNDYVFCKLLDVLGIEFSEPKQSSSTPGLSDSQRDFFDNKKFESADCLREMALILEKQGLLEDAKFIIEKALAERPGGETIKAISSRISNKLDLIKLMNSK